MTPPPTSLTLTSLLNSLHTHLQSQTQLLPTLHAQLGLPPTALEDELKNLQQQLMHSVESQIDIRRKEVDRWMEKCDEVENLCLRYSKALGGNIKATGSSVGELRKEQVLPKRYEMVTVYHEKLRQLYHTKFEQLTTLTNRLNALSRTLGDDYFSRDIVDPTPAPGEDDHDPSANRDVTPERFSKLEKELVRGKGEVAKRLAQLSTTFLQIDWLYGELGIVPPSLDDLPESATTSPFHTNPHANTSASSSSNPNSDPFLLTVSTPTPSSRTKPLTPLLFRADPLPPPDTAYERIFAAFVARIDEAESEATNSSTPLGLESVDPTPSLLHWATALRASLEETKRTREAHIQALYDQLEGLWRRLGVADADMDAFVEAHRGSTEETVREYEEELERMLELKRERMGAFVGSAREEIEGLWGELMVGDEEREGFAPFVDDEHTEELLTLHEIEIKRLKDERRVKAPLLASIKKYFDICEEEKELAAAAADQTRLLGRGGGGKGGGRDPGRLLREEKMRKRVMKEKPRLEQDLLASIPAWEQQAGRPFLVHGESILEILMETVSAADQENAKRKPRAGSVPLRATTPTNNTNNINSQTNNAHSSNTLHPTGFVPGAKTGVVTPAIRPGSSLASQSVPNKRQRLDESTSGHAPSFGVGTGRAPLTSSRGGNGTGAGTGVGVGRLASPSKIPSKTSGNSTLPRLRSGSGQRLQQQVPTIVMPVPRAGTQLQQHGLGHGRAPSVMPFNGGGGGGYHSQAGGGGMRSSSNVGSLSVSSLGGYGRYASAGVGGGENGGYAGTGTGGAAGAVKRASRTRRESFKPRPSADSAPDMGKSVGGKWGAFAASVKEEDEGY